MKHRQDIVTGIVIAILAGAGVLEARTLPTGAAMLPTATLGVLILLSGLMIGRGVIGALKATEAMPTPPFIVAPKRLAIGIVAMALYIAGIEVIGFYATTAIFIPCTALVLGGCRFKFIALASLGFLGFVYVVFTLIFERVLPTGIAFTFLAGTFLIFGGGAFV